MIDTIPGSKSTLCHADNVFLSTLSGGAPAVEICVDRAETYVGPKLRGNSGFFPSGRDLRSIWPETRLEYLMLSIPDKAFEATVERNLIGGEWSVHIELEDEFSRSSLAAIANAIRRPTSPVQQLFVDSLLTALQIRTLERSSSFPISAPVGREDLAKVFRYIESNLAEPITLADLANLAGLSRNGLLAAFAAKTGMTPRRFITWRRLERAKQMLLDPRRSVGEVARLVGCADQSGLTVLFRKHLGTTPSAWRHYSGRENKSGVD